MSNYVITPRLIEISEIKLDEKIQAQESLERIKELTGSRSIYPGQHQRQSSRVSDKGQDELQRVSRHPERR